MGRTAKARVLAGALGGAALAAAAVVGCGSNTETSSIVSAPTKSSATTSKSAFVRQADAKAIQSGTSGAASTEVESATSAAQAAARAFGLRACAGSATPSGSASG